MINIKELKVNYNNETTVEISDLKIEEKKITGLLGANGSGKSTLLKSLAKVLDNMELSIDGEYNIAYMPQNPYLFNLTVMDNIKLVEKDEGKILEYLKEFGIDHLIKKKRISGGEAQKVAFIRTLLTESDTILLDEPTSAIDINSIRIFEKRLIFEKENNKKTIILSTHSPAQAFRICDNIIFLDNGRVLFYGNTNEFKTSQDEIIKKYLNCLLQQE